MVGRACERGHTPSIATAATVSYVVGGGCSVTIGGRVVSGKHGGWNINGMTTIDGAESGEIIMDYAGQLTTFAMTADWHKTLAVVLSASEGRFTGDCWADLVNHALTLSGPLRFRGSKLWNTGSRLLQRTASHTSKDNILLRQMQRTGAGVLLKAMFRGVVVVVVSHESMVVPNGCLCLASHATMVKHSKWNGNASDASTAVLHYRGSSLAAFGYDVAWPSQVRAGEGWAQPKPYTKTSKSKREMKTTDVRALRMVTIDAAIMTLRALLALNGAMYTAVAATKLALYHAPPALTYAGDDDFFHRPYTMTSDVGLWPTEG